MNDSNYTPEVSGEFPTYLEAVLHGAGDIAQEIEVMQRIVTQQLANKQLSYRQSGSVKMLVLLKHMAVAQALNYAVMSHMTEVERLYYAEEPDFLNKENPLNFQ